MAEVGDFFAVVEHFTDFIDGGFGVAAVEKELHDFLIGAAVQGAFEGGDGGGDAGVHVGESRGGHAGGECAGIEAMLGVENQGGVEDADQGLCGLLPVSMWRKFAAMERFGCGSIGF